MKNKKVLILGASSDIGVRTVEKFLNQNYDVVAHYNKNNKKLNHLKKQFNSLKIFKLDLRNINQVENFFKKKSVAKNVDIFISLSGYLSFSNFENFFP